jgi:hypothetical protein
MIATSWILCYDLRKPNNLLDLFNAPINFGMPNNYVHIPAGTPEVNEGALPIGNLKEIVRHAE